MSEKDIELIEFVFKEIHKLLDYKSIFKKEFEIIDIKTAYDGKTDRFELEKLLQAITNSINTYNSVLLKSVLLALKERKFFD